MFHVSDIRGGSDYTMGRVVPVNLALFTMPIDIKMCPHKKCPLDNQVFRFSPAIVSQAIKIGSLEITPRGGYPPWGGSLRLGLVRLRGPTQI